jgi:hypothetical protein
MKYRGGSAAFTEQELDEIAENGLRALRMATEKALRQQVVTLEELEDASRRLEGAGFDLTGVSVPLTPGVVLDEDPNLALAFLRIELEKQLRKVIRSTLEAPTGILELTYEKGYFTGSQASALVHLLTLLNSAVHGALVTKDAPAWVDESGSRIVSAVVSRTRKSEA